ncbi:hypothetical protein [Lentzea sp. NPDC051838]|uniref:COG1470 family protein n=1 Tax=Lentzea sp. NPDC051838 TaxID=3154849 RepID=UPI0034214AA4
MNEVSGPVAGNVVQAGTINGDVSIAAQSDDLGVYFKHQRDQVHLRVGATECFHLTIINRTCRSRVLELEVESATTTGLPWKIADREPDEAIQLGSNDTIKLRLNVHCTSSATAGPDVLKVLVRETGERTWCSSEPLPIHIEAAPNLDVVLAQPVERVHAAGTYETVLTLKNNGNTDVSGKLMLVTRLDTRPDAPLCLRSDMVTFLDDAGFCLRQGDPPLNLRVALTVPQIQVRRNLVWKVPLTVQTASWCSGRFEFAITQFGLEPREPRLLKWLLKKLNQGT